MILLYTTICAVAVIDIAVYIICICICDKSISIRSNSSTSCYSGSTSALNALLIASYIDPNYT